MDAFLRAFSRSLKQAASRQDLLKDTLLDELDEFSSDMPRMPVQMHSLCCPRHGDVLIFGGVFVSLKGGFGWPKTPITGCFRGIRNSLAFRCGSRSTTSSMLCTTPAGTPAACNISITSSAVCRAVHSDTSASSASSFSSSTPASQTSPLSTTAGSQARRKNPSTHHQ